MDVLGGKYDGADRGFYSDDLLAKAKELEGYGAVPRHASKVVANLRRIAQYTYLHALALYVCSLPTDTAICSKCWHPLTGLPNVCPGCGHPLLRRKPQKPAGDEPLVD